MKKLLFYIYFIVLLLALSASSAIALRCGNDLIREGDTTMKVRITLQNNGGEIITKEYIGSNWDGTINSQTKGTVDLKTKGRNTSGSYTSNTNTDYASNTEVIEKWFIKAPSGYGSPYCYELTFVGSVLKEIGPGIQCK